MSKKIEISESIFERLQKLAKPFIDTPETVIRRLLDHYESIATPKVESETLSSEENADLSKRYPRQRGAKIKIGDEVFSGSVKEVYSEILQHLYQEGYLEKLKPLLPIRTSPQRYIISESPVHPSGRKFWIPVEYKGYYMEAHKDWKNGIPHLAKMLAHCGLKVIYLGPI